MLFSSKIKLCRPNETLVDYLSRRFGYRSPVEWAMLVEEEKIQVNGKKALPQTMIFAGDVVSYQAVDWEEPPANFNYRIIYEDEFLLAVDKPPNLMVHSAGRVIRNTLIFHLRYANPSTMPYGNELKLVNRLDKETSGLVLLAKDKTTLTLLHKQFAGHKVEKEYTGICFGVLEEKEFDVRLPVGPHTYSRIKGKFGRNAEKGKDAITRFKVLEQTHAYSLLCIRPFTGRTNQIRVHAEAVAHPLVGDKLYSGNDEVFLEWCKNGMTPELLAKLKMPRQALHAGRLSFLHPRDNHPLSLEAPLPDDMVEFWKNAKQEAGILP